MDLLDRIRIDEKNKNKIKNLNKNHSQSLLNLTPHTNFCTERGKVNELFEFCCKKLYKKSKINYKKNIINKLKLRS